MYIYYISIVCFISVMALNSMDITVSEEEQTAQKLIQECKELSDHLVDTVRMIQQRQTFTQDDKAILSNSCFTLAARLALLYSVCPEFSTYYTATGHKRVTYQDDFTAEQLRMKKFITDNHLTLQKILSLLNAIKRECQKDLESLRLGLRINALTEQKVSFNTTKKSHNSRICCN